MSRKSAVQLPVARTHRTEKQTKLYIQQNNSYVSIVLDLVSLPSRRLSLHLKPPNYFTANYPKRKSVKQTIDCPNAYKKLN